MSRPTKHSAPRVLIYGFGPYRQFTDNITARIVKALPRQHRLKKIIFPVRFSRRQFVDPIRKYRPDVILGLGQSARQTIDIETRARNWRRAGKAKPRRPIAAGKPKTLPVTLAIAAGGMARRSHGAGDYVCNYSMYVMLDEIVRKSLAVQYGFVHIPHDWDERKARRFVAAILRRCAKAGLKRR